jgi:hypothetical protein
MKVIDPKTMFERRDQPWFDLLEIHVDRAAFKQWINAEPVVEWVDGLGDADYWIIEFDCGLLLSFEFLHLCKGGHVRVTEPNANHAIRHLAHWRSELSVYPDDTFSREREWAFEHFSTTLPNLRLQDCAQAWRQGDDGNPMKIGYPTSELDATCLVRELESRGHKQIYWVENV